MASNAKVLLFVYGECGGGVTEEEFNAWYDDEHAPARLTVPGIFTAVRYESIDHKPPKWLALYDLASTSVLQTEEYQSLRTKASQNERNVISRLSLLNRQIFTLVSVIPSSPASHTTYGNFLYVVHMNIITTKDSEADHEAEFINWYSATRVELLKKVPGWIRSRIFKLESHSELAGMADKASPLAKKTPTKFIALHEWDRDGTDVIDSSEFKECMTAEKPWTTQVQRAYAEMEDRRFALYKTFNH